jgi:transcriptional regulator with XRE-family HTH domain
MAMDDGVGRRIRELRIARERSQAELTGPGLSPGYLSMIESGRRPASPAVLARLAALLDTTPEYLATGTQPDQFLEAERRLAFAELALHNGSAAAALAEFDQLLAEIPAPLAERAHLGRAKALEGLNLLPEAAEVYQALGDAAEPGGAQWAERQMDLTRCYSHAGQLQAAIDVGERALAVFESLGLEWSDETIRLGVTLAGCYAHRSDSLHAAGLLRRLLEAADRLGSPLARGSVLWNSAIAAADNGRPRDAAALAQHALALLGEAGHRRNLATLRALYGQYLAETEPDQARKALALQQEALNSMIEAGNSAHISWIEIRLANTALQLGDVALARTHARNAIERIRGLDEENEAEARLTLAEAEQAAGENTAARQSIDAACEALQCVVTQSRITAGLWHRIAVLREALDDAPGALSAYRRAMHAAGFSTPTAAYSSTPSRQA